METKKKLRAQIADLKRDANDRQAAIDHQNHIIEEMQSEVKKWIRRVDTLSTKIATYEKAYHSAQEFLLRASEAMTGAYTAMIASAGDDTGVNTNDD